jgi:hypothetical protein
MLGARTLTGPDGLTVARDTCPAVLEPDQTCAVAVRFTPVAAGGGSGQLTVPSDGGAVSLPLRVVAISVSGLSSSQLSSPRFVAGPAGDGVGERQQLVLSLVNRLPAPVHAGAAALAGPDAARFRLTANTCRGVHLRTGGSCRISVAFTPTRVGHAAATLTLGGDGLPLTVPLRAAASAPPSIRLLAPAQAGPRCPASEVVVVTSEPAAVGWTAIRSTRPIDLRCAGVARAAAGSRGVVALRGRSRTGRTARVTDGRRGYATTVRLGRRLRPGVYRLTARPVNVHGRGRARATWVTVTG